jgi:hypothetical protein
VAAYGHWSLCADKKTTKVGLRECIGDHSFYASVISRKRRIVLRGHKMWFHKLSRILNGKGLRLSVPAHCRSGRGGHGPCATCNDLLTCPALPDADRLTLDAVLNERGRSTHASAIACVCGEKLRPCLATKRAGVSCVLRDFHLVVKE